MQTVRPAAIAGHFYPAQASALKQLVLTLLGQVAEPEHGVGEVPKAILVPHAGYIYSGATAALAYARLRPGRECIRRVVLLGPAHRVHVKGLALPGASSFTTPLGEVTIDQDARDALVRLPQVLISEAAHAAEHSLEVQLPFLQCVLGDFKLLPLLAGDVGAPAVAEVIESLWGDDETLIVISTDLSHFLPYAQAQVTDQATLQHILQLDASLTHHQACGGTPVNGFLLAARQHRLCPHLLGACNSGDSAGDKRRVVGYASVAFVPQVHHGH
ncbi:MAG: AmmeMemoRadiSam system protein B [Rhodoferax sp.]|jgi:AmmeMemoRadiSam system protein B|uniref:AmmeMemoRadiSam system protein B n=1 Tax=Rhodoferax sp. TaxID=50421 RepID=UPI001B78E678|nr:AmmeMemoRadiSam system protein B [Rhodoferax sp.]MBP8287142.1 AmmeMemoRadiSam system protein B [Rhodoferax sp.]MBP9147409.1 AmmeMemoRadiSam system protein B [Rhodoferax sp.]MBP9735055.1 AmmeMemoRadiSam system protein B [Rhodoferax sp.]